MDINNPNLRKAFPLVFHPRHGILSNTAFGIKENIDGTFDMTYHKTKSNNIKIATLKSEKHQFQEDLRKNTPSYTKQADFSADHVDTNKSKSTTEKGQDINK